MVNNVEKNTYNGWTNKETWLVNLWFESDLYTYLQESGIRDVYDAAEYLESTVEEFMPELSGLEADLFNCAFCAINWRELAECYLADIANAEKEES